MKINSIVFAAVISLAAATSSNAEVRTAQADGALVPALNKGTLVNTTPQVAYPPICRHDPLFPRYCRRW